MRNKLWKRQFLGFRKDRILGSTSEERTIILGLEPGRTGRLQEMLQLLLDFECWISHWSVISTDGGKKSEDVKTSKWRNKIWEIIFKMWLFQSICQARPLLFCLSTTIIHRYLYLYYSSSSQILNCFKPRIHNFLLINNGLNILKKKFWRYF